jgi:hypothetical protein
MKKLGEKVALVLILTFVVGAIILAIASFVHAASSQRINLDRFCENKAKEAGGIFDMITENPKVILNGMIKGDEDEFAFIREWVKDKKTRDDLLTWVKDNCMGVPI